LIGQPLGPKTRGLRVAAFASLAPNLSYQMVAISSSREAVGFPAGVRLFFLADSFRALAPAYACAGSSLSETRTNSARDWTCIFCMAGEATKMETVELKWPASGIRRVLTDLAPNHCCHVREGDSKALPVELKRIHFDWMPNQDHPSLVKALAALKPSLRRDAEGFGRGRSAPRSITFSGSITATGWRKSRCQDHD
jgi:hypothetical protein